jgi:hypothetical protein
MLRRHFHERRQQHDGIGMLTRLGQRIQGDGCAERMSHDADVRLTGPERPELCLGCGAPLDGRCLVFCDCR